MEQINIPRVKVVNKGESWLGTQCYINNQEIGRVKSVDFHASVEEVPTFDFEMMGCPEIDMLGSIRFSFTPKTVEEAVKVLRNELMKYEDIYNGFLASIKSALDEYEHMCCRSEDANIDLSNEILKRIIGKE